MALRLIEQQRKPARDFEIIRIELQRLLERRDRIRGAAGLDQRVAEMAPELGVVGLELHSLVEGLDRLLAPPLPEQRGAEAGEIQRFWIGEDGAGHPIDGGVE